MAREDDYRNAAALAKDELAAMDPERLAGLCGAQAVAKQGAPTLEFSFLGQQIQAHWPQVDLVRADADQEVPIQQQVLLLHYLQGAWKSGGPDIAGEWMAFQDVPDGKFYMDAFHRRAKFPLLQAFGRRPESLKTHARSAYGAQPIDLGDVSVSIPALPRIRVALVLWAGDDEFPPEGNILFDRNTNAYLSAEDMAWLSGMIVYPLMGIARHDEKAEQEAKNE